MENCISCGMPLNEEEDIGAKIEKGLVCKFCVNPDKSVKSCQEVFDGVLGFL